MTDVLVVGAGPTGLMLALWLARAGISVRIIDRLDAPQPYSRALGVQARTLEFYRMLGFAEDVIAAGTVAQQVRIRAKQRIAAQLELGEIGTGSSRYPFVLFLAQDVHEDLLRAQLESMGVTVEWGTELTNLMQTRDSVSATLNVGEHTTTSDVSYLCGADGAGSTVRKLLGIGFPGQTSGKLFYVADVELEEAGEAPVLELCVNRSGLGAVMPSRHTGSVRFLGLVPEALEGMSDMTLERVAAPVLQQTGHVVRQVNWFSVYQVHHRVAERFRSGRVFLLGDSGHVHSPAGAQGMNTGLGDAVNLGWKLADVIVNGARVELLDSYEPERIRFAHELVTATDRAFSLMSRRGWAGRLLREVVIPHLAPWTMRLRPVRQLMFRTISQTRIAYRQSPLSSGRAGRIAAGDRLPWIDTSDGDNHAVLDGRWQMHVYSGVHGTPEPDLPLVRFDFGPEAKAAGYIEDAVYLVRPDGHIAAIGSGEGAISQATNRYRQLFRLGRDSGETRR